MPISFQPYDLEIGNGGTQVHYLATGAATKGEFGLYRWDFTGPPSGPDPHLRSDDPITKGAIMTIELDHTIVPARDPKTSAQFLADILGLTVDPPVAHFTPITLANKVTLDYDQHDDFDSHHYAFLISEEEFDAAFARIQAGGITHYADPACQQAGQIYRSHGRRGTYFRDPNGHLMEILTPAA